MIVHVLQASLNKGFFNLDGLDLPKNHFALKYDGDLDSDIDKNFTLYNIYNKKQVIISRHYSEVQGFTSWDELLQALHDLDVLASDVNSDSPALDVVLQDSTSPIFDLFFSQALAPPTTLQVDSIKDSYQIEVANPSAFALGVWTGIFSGTGRYYWGEVLGVNGNTLTLDTPLDFDFVAGSNVLPTNRNLAVNGSVTPQVFTIQAGGSGLNLDVVRVILSIVCNTPVELSKFGDLDALSRGVVLRKKDGETRNFWNVKTNYAIGVHCFDVSVYEQVKQNDVNALLARMTYGGQSKHGAVIRISETDELQLIVQDDLTGLEVFLAVAEGSEVVN